MKKIIYMIVLSLLVLYILIFPTNAIEAASNGLILWYQKMLPTLLPFAILSYILIHSGMLSFFAKVIHKILRWMIPISEAGIYPLLAGFLFGFPLGSKITSELVLEGQMSKKEGDYLFGICNNISPLFVSSFILQSCIQRVDLIIPSLIFLYLPPLLYYCFTAPRDISFQNTKNTTSRSQMNFKIIDAGIMNGFETLTKLGGYIMIFAILAQMTKKIPITSDFVSSLLIGTMELTNGIVYTSGTMLPFEIKYPLILFFTAFGGFCGMAQTASMVKEANLNFTNYIKTKIICAKFTYLLAFIYVKIIL